jgi:hypothetical protein
MSPVAWEALLLLGGLGGWLAWEAVIERRRERRRQNTDTRPDA